MIWTPNYNSVILLFKKLFSEDFRKLDSVNRAYGMLEIHIT